MNKLSKIEVFSIALGSIIGWGAFMLPANKFLPEAGIINTFLGLALGAFTILIIENSYKFMIVINDDEGGEFSFTYHYLGKKHGFISGWFLGLAYLSIVPLNATALPLVIDKVLNGALKVGYLYTISGYDVFLGEVIISMIVILLFAILNIKGIKKAGKMQIYLTLFLVGIVLLISLVMFIKTPLETISINYINNYRFDIKEIFRIFAITPWAYIGFDAIPQLMKNFNFPKEKSSTISILSILFGLFIYTLLNVMTGLVYAPEALNNISWPTGEAVFITLGYTPFLLLCLALLCAVCSGVNGFFVSTSKLLSAMSDYQVLPFENIKKSNQIFYFITIVSLIAPWFGREALSVIVDMSSIGAAISYGYVCFIVSKKSYKRKDIVLGKIGVIISGIFVGLLILPESPASLSFSAMIALGVWIIIGLFYYFKMFNQNEKKILDISNIEIEN